MLRPCRDYASHGTQRRLQIRFQMQIEHLTSRERKRAVGSIGTECVAETTPFDKLMAKCGHGTQRRLQIVDFRLQIEHLITSRERKRAVGSIGTECVAETAPFDKLMAKCGHGTGHPLARN